MQEDRVGGYSYVCVCAARADVCVARWPGSKANLGVPSPAATLPLVVPPFIFESVQQALLVELEHGQVHCASLWGQSIVGQRKDGASSQ